MAKFPDNATIGRFNPEEVTIRQKTLVSQFDELGKEKRKRKWVYPKRDVTVRFEARSKAEIATLYAFYLARSGSYEAFSFFLGVSQTYVGEYVGTGDGATLAFDLPAVSSSSYKLYVDSVEQEAGVAYTFSAAGGTDGADQVTFTVAPNDGTRITYDFTGYLKIRARFAEDNMTYETFYNKFTYAGLQLRGMLNDE